MTTRLTIPLFGAITILALAAPVHAQTSQGDNTSSAAWTPQRLADGQPDIQGMWNNIDAFQTPLELPEDLTDQNLSAEELQARAEARKKDLIESSEIGEGVGAYGAHWYDWYWKDAVGGDEPSLVVEPSTRRLPGFTEAAAEVVAYNRERLHDSYEYMESADRCITRGILGMMMPTFYNNGTLILQPPGYVVLHSEMIHTARIIPIDGSDHPDDSIRQWDGDPRGHWEGNTLVIESTNFRAVQSMRGAWPTIRSRQSESQRVVERFTIVDPTTLRYSVTIDDPETYAGPWTAAFPMKRDDDYIQYEYACHEGNYSVPNSLSGARAEESR
jgi:hypothetical protein